MTKLGNVGYEATIQAIHLMFTYVVISSASFYRVGVVHVGSVAAFSRVIPKEANCPFECALLLDKSRFSKICN